MMCRTLTFSDGCVWRFAASDGAAVDLLSHFGTVMGAGPGEPTVPEGGLLRELTLSASPVDGAMWSSLPAAVEAARMGLPARCEVDVLDADENRMTGCSFLVAALLGIEAQTRGGALVHGALAVSPGPDGPHGVLLAGRSGAGKSTASRRLRSPWVSWSDDMTLIVRAGDGSYRAHPWPTWSQLWDGGGGGPWDTSSSVPLRAIFFLEHAASDLAQPLGPGHAAAELVEALKACVQVAMRDLEPRTARVIRAEWFDFSCSLARRLPAFRLQVSLAGRFWEEIDRCLDGMRTHAVGDPRG